MIDVKKNLVTHELCRIFFSLRDKHSSHGKKKSQRHPPIAEN